MNKNQKYPLRNVVKVYTGTYYLKSMDRYLRNVEIHVLDCDHEILAGYTRKSGKRRCHKCEAAEHHVQPTGGTAPLKEDDPEK